MGGDLYRSQSRASPDAIRFDAVSSEAPIAATGHKTSHSRADVEDLRVAKRHKIWRHGIQDLLATALQNVFNHLLLVFRSLNTLPVLLPVAQQQTAQFRFRQG